MPTSRIFINASVRLHHKSLLQHSWTDIKNPVAQDLIWRMLLRKLRNMNLLENELL